MTKSAETKKSAIKKAVKATPISICVRVDKKTVCTKKATSVCNMWKLNKELFKEYPTAILFIKKDGKEFMKLHLVQKSNGKAWMKNDIEASRRKPTVKATVESETDEAAANEMIRIHRINEQKTEEVAAAAEA